MKKYTLKTFQSPKKLKIDYQKELNSQQYKAVTQTNGPCLVLAGAGSGKTRTLVYRLVYLLEQGINPSRIMLVTFTNKASREMLNRVETLYGKKPKGLWGGTFHSIGNRVLQIYGQHIGIAPNFTILDNEDSKTMIKSCLSGVSIPRDKCFPKSDLIRKMISLSINLSQPIETVVAIRFSYLNEEYIPLIKNIADVYQQKKKQANALDFDDLLFQWNRLLLEKSAIREKLAYKFQYVLVDEYQDTNRLQGEIITHLAGLESNGQNVLAVGDDYQSIYSFRGADVNNILNFPDIFPCCQKFYLTVNYRSTPQILGLANQSIDNNKEQFKKNLITNKKGGVKPVLAAANDVHQQAEFICQRIIDLQEEGIALDEIAILFRAHYQSLELEMEMNKRNIPYVMRGGLRFFEQAHIKDVVAYLKIFNNMHDELSWQRALQLESGIGGVSADRVWQIVSKLSYLSEVFDYPFNEVLSQRAVLGCQKVLGLLRELTKLKNWNAGGLIEKVLKSGYQEFVKNSFDNFEDRMNDLEQLVLFASGYDNLAKFLSDVALSEGFRGSSVEGYEKRADEAVALTTIHQAKGLEWEVVFVLGLVNGQFPGMQVVEKPEQMEEERRLFYVATTRAQDQLYLTYPIFSRRSGNINQVSQFIEELPESVYDQWQIDEETEKSSSFSSSALLRRGSGSGYKEPTIELDENGDEIESDVAKEFWSRIIANSQKHKK